jgi:hypothetical protein
MCTATTVGLVLSTTKPPSNVSAPRSPRWIPSLVFAGDGQQAGIRFHPAGSEIAFARVLLLKGVGDILIDRASWAGPGVTWQGSAVSNNNPMPTHALSA